jgi:S1-C subfamily serine protease
MIMARKPLRRLVFQILAAIVAALPVLPLDAAVAMSVADTRPVALSAAAERSYQRLMEATHAVVGVKVKALADARSNESLGRDRVGSGVAIGKEGLVLTIGYLILEAEAIEVTDFLGRKAPATTVAYDHATGFGLVKPMGRIASRPIELGTALSVAQLDRMMIVTGGEEQNISIATVVSRRPFAGYWEYLIDDAIFTSPPRLDHSGAALINKEGELVAIGSLFVLDALAPGEKLPGNMFVPVDLLRPVLDEMVKTGSQQAGRRPWLGVNSLEEDGRIKVVQVNEESPAAEAGIVAGDMILAIDGETVASLETFYGKLWTRGPAGVNVRLTVLHGPTTREVVVRSIDRAEFIRKRQACK